MGSQSGGGRRTSRRWVIVAGITILLAATVLTQGGEVAYDTASPPLVTQVPSNVPAGGVNINDEVTLMPPVGGATLLKSSLDAIQAARKYGDARRFPPTTLLCTFTVPGTIPPPDSPVPFRTIQDRLAWVITFSWRKPQPVGVGGKVSIGAAGPPLGPYATHLNVALDADTGEFLLGFYTA